MEKNNLKWYEAPQVEVVEMETGASLLAGSGGNEQFGGLEGDEGDEL